MNVMDAVKRLSGRAGEQGVDHGGAGIPSRAEVYTLTRDIIKIKSVKTKSMGTGSVTSG